MTNSIPMTLIYWRDAKYSAGWHTPGEVPSEPCEVETLGWLIKETDEAVIMALSISPDTQTVGHVSVIPKSGITARFQLPSSALENTSDHIVESLLQLFDIRGDVDLVNYIKARVN